jgi:hypothetical protein
VTRTTVTVDVDHIDEVRWIGGTHRGTVTITAPGVELTLSGSQDQLDALVIRLHEARDRHLRFTDVS